MDDRQVLVTDGGNGQGRSALAAVRALALDGWRPVVTVSGRWSLAAASRHAAGSVQMPGVAVGGDAYARSLAKEVGSGRYVAVVPASDAAVVALDVPGAALADKSVMEEEATRSGLQPVPSRHFPSWDALVEAISTMPFPVVVKPRRSTSPARAFEEPGGVVRAQPMVGELLVQPFIAEPMTAVSGVRHLGRLVAVVHQRYERTWPVPCGTASYAVTVAGDRELEDHLGVLLGEHEGVFQAQFAGPYLLDVNPRVYGSLPLAVAAGANLVGLHCSLASGRKAPPSQPIRARPGVRYRWTEGDARNLMSGLRHRRLKPGPALWAARPRRHTVHSVTLVSDPNPGLVRLAHVLFGRS